VPPPPYPRPCTTTTVTFVRATPSSVGAALSPYPNRPMEPLDLDASPWGRRGRPCAIHGWGSCPNRVASVHRPSSLGRQGGEGEEEQEEEDEHRITVVTDPVGASAIHRMTRISIGPRGRPQGPLAPRTATTPPKSSTLSLVVPPPPPDLLSPCGNRVLRWFTRFVAPSGKGRVPKSWDSTARPSH
jgi:hypothetical protein